MTAMFADDTAILATSSNQAVVKSLTLRGFRFLFPEFVELIGSSKNGCFLGLLELISEFDPFVTNCSAESSFSCLKRIKSYLRCYRID